MKQFPIRHQQFTRGIISDVRVVELQKHHDGRGWLMELYRSDEMQNMRLPAMAYLSESSSGVTRGPHAHRLQTDHFIVVGPGEFEFCCWDDRPESDSAGIRQVFFAGASRPARISIPPLVVHAYRNTGDEPGWLMNFPDQLYAGDGRQQPVDEVRFEDCPNHPFHW